MSIMRLTQRLRDASVALQQARDDGDQEAIEALEDEIFELEEELAFEEDDEYQDRHDHGWN